jgi:hypothetical protein
LCYIAFRIGKSKGEKLLEINATTYFGHAGECGVNEDWEGAVKQLELCLAADPDPAIKVCAHSLMIQALDKLNGPEGESGGGPYGERIKALVKDLNAMLNTDSINEYCKEHLPNNVYQENHKTAIWSSAQYKTGIFAGLGNADSASKPDGAAVSTGAAGQNESRPGGNDFSEIKSKISKMRGDTIALIVTGALLLITVLCLFGGAFIPAFIFLILTLIVGFFGVRVYISEVMHHSLTEISRRYSAEDIMTTLRQAFDEARSWKPVTGPGKLNMRYTKLGGLVSDPVLSATLRELDDNTWELDIWVSAIEESKGIPKRGGVAIKMREKCLESLARYV